MKDKYDIGKTLALIAVFFVIAVVASGCATEPKPLTNCVTWTDGSDPRARSAQNTECKSRQRTRDVLRNAGYQQ